MGTRFGQLGNFFLQTNCGTDLKMGMWSKASKLISILPWQLLLEQEEVPTSHSIDGHHSSSWPHRGVMFSKEENDVRSKGMGGEKWEWVNKCSKHNRLDVTFPLSWFAIVC